MMKVFKNTKIKILLIFVITLVVYALWEIGLEDIYSRTLVGASNIVLSITKDNTHIELEKTINDDYQFRVHTMVTDRKASFPQEIGGLLQPFIIILSWQIFLFFVLTPKSALKSLAINIVVFMIIQIFFLHILTGYYNSDTNKFIFNSLLDTFYIFALILIIKDNLLYNVFGKQRS
jgi:hypothetical protein